MSQRLCQDPLERFFGCQRQRGRVHDNPNAAEFLKNTQALRVTNSFSHHPNRGNCRGGNVEIAEATCEPLPKRRCRSQQKAVVYNESQSAIDLGKKCIVHRCMNFNSHIHLLQEVAMIPY